MTDEQTVKHLREIVDIKFEENEKALKIQAQEYERRLEALNGEAERLRQMQTTYLPRELYSIEHKELVKKIDNLQMIVYVGMGILLTVQFVLRFV